MSNFGFYDFNIGSQQTTSGINRNKTVLIVGGNGFLGHNLTTWLEKNENLNIIVTSRKQLNYSSVVRFIEMDLQNPECVEVHKDILKNVNYVLYTTHDERDGIREEVVLNMEMFKNLILGVEKYSESFEQVVLVQDSKAYGSQFGHYKTPAKEDDKKFIPPNLSYNQEEFLKYQSEGKRWNWTVLRSDTFIGYSMWSTLNITNIIAIYAILCRELNVPFRFPGTEKAYKSIVNFTNIDLFSSAMIWSLQNEKCKNQIFNITNGDVFRWEQAWPVIAKFFEVEMGEPQPFYLETQMEGKEEYWSRIVERYGLQTYTLKQLVEWSLGDKVFKIEYDSFYDVGKARRYGFKEMNRDSMEDLIQTFKELRYQKIIP